MLKGIDVSSWQGNIQVRNMPVDFVIAKATEGLAYVNEFCDPVIRNSIRFGDMKGKTLPASGAKAWIEFGASTPCMKTGNTLIVSANISIPVSCFAMGN